MVILYDLIVKMASGDQGGRMDKKYRAVVFKMPNNSDKAERRYVIKDMESGEIVDDAQGYGYKSAQKAYAGWAYKRRDKSKDTEKAEKERAISKWTEENKTFIRLLDTLAFEKWKDTRTPVDAGFVKKLLEENGYIDLNFTAGNSAGTDPWIMVLSVHLNELFKVHIQIAGNMKLKLVLIFDSFTLG